MGCQFLILNQYHGGAQPRASTGSSHTRSLHTRRSSRRVPAYPALLDLADWANLPYRWGWILLSVENRCAYIEVGLGVPARGDLCVWYVPFEGCADFTHSPGPL